MDQELLSQAGRLSVVLRRFEETCKEYRLGVSGFVEALRSYARDAERTDRWVWEIGHGFEEADRGFWRGFHGGAGISWRWFGWKTDMELGSLMETARRWSLKIDRGKESLLTYEEVLPVVSSEDRGEGEGNRGTIQSDESFDAEVGGPSLEEWYRLRGEAEALRIEAIQRQAKSVCEEQGEGSAECLAAWERAQQEVGRVVMVESLRPLVPRFEPMDLSLSSMEEPPPPQEAWVRPYTLNQWARFHQTQTGNDDCNAFALAMAQNLLYADQPDRWLGGDEVQRRLEHHWGIVPASRWTWLRWRLRYWYLPPPLFPPPVLLPNKVPGVGIPTWQYDNAIRQILPEAEVEHKVGATPEDLKRAIATGKIVIVAVGWDSTSEIAWKFAKSKWDWGRNKPNPQQPSTIGHYMVVVGYDAQQLYLLNPAERAEVPDKWPWKRFQEVWQRGNIFVEPRSIWILDADK